MALLEFTIQKRFPPSRSAPGFELDVRFDCDAGVTVLFGASGSGKTLKIGRASCRERVYVLV